MSHLGPTLPYPRYHAQLETNRGDGAGPQTDHAEGSDPKVIAAWLRAQADHLDPRKPVLRGDRARFYPPRPAAPEERA